MYINLYVCTYAKVNYRTAGAATRKEKKKTKNVILATKVVCPKLTRNAPHWKTARGVAFAIKWKAKALALALVHAVAHQMFVEIIVQYELNAKEVNSINL